jgi:hypothetical protein
MTAQPTDAIAPPSLYGLSFLWLEITEKCNLECSHCYADSGPRRELRGQMGLEDWYRVIRESADLGCRQIQFIGGEPTLHPDLVRMIEYASECGYTFIEVFTNATVLSDRLLRAFVTSGVHIATSFYSDDPNTHDLITGRSGSLRQTIAGIRRLIAAGLHVRAGIIETKENVGHGQRAWLFLNGLGVSDIKIDFQRGIGRGAERLYSPEPMSQLCGECWKGKLCATSSGTAYPCVFSRFAGVGAVRNGIRKIIEGDELLAFRANLSKRQHTQTLNHVPEPNGNSGHANVPGDRGHTGLVAQQCGPLECNPQTCLPCGPYRFCNPCGPDRFIECQPGRGDCVPLSKCNPACSPGAPCLPDTLPRGSLGGERDNK